MSSDSCLAANARLELGSSPSQWDCRIVPEAKTEVPLCNHNKAKTSFQKTRSIPAAGHPRHFMIEPALSKSAGCHTLGKTDVTVATHQSLRSALLRRFEYLALQGSLSERG